MDCSTGALGRINILAVRHYRQGVNAGTGVNKYKGQKLLRLKIQRLLVRTSTSDTQKPDSVSLFTSRHEFLIGTKITFFRPQSEASVWFDSEAHEVAFAMSTGRDEGDQQLTAGIA